VGKSIRLKGQFWSQAHRWRGRDFGRHFGIANGLNRRFDCPMKFWMLLASFGLMLTNAVAAEKETRFFELRTYYAAPGKLEALLTRFRDHTTAIFSSHGMVNIGYWVPLTNSENKLIYLLAYPSREAREKAWKEFWADPVWQAVVKESEKDGKLVRKAESVFLYIRA
jgi:hypothetical protein